jgi:hypothetical protein
MTRKLARRAIVALVGCAVIAPLGGCDSTGSQEKPTIDTTSPIKAPGEPSVKKVEIRPPGGGKK